MLKKQGFIGRLKEKSDFNRWYPLSQVFLWWLANELNLFNDNDFLVRKVVEKFYTKDGQSV
ncbi:MAG: hypothetical protein JXA33_16125 [Anaerolineae bacterium]|nr:hypothetical protein [Anaerolineae bacterium]